MGLYGAGMSGVLTFGEAMIRLSVPPGESLETAPAFDVHVAGSEANVAATLARMGRQVSWVSALPDSQLGRRVIGELRAAGVDCSDVALVPGARMGTYFVDLQADPLPARVIYDRSGSAVAGYRSDDFPWPRLDTTPIVHLSGITPALSPECRELSMELTRRARASGATLSVDINYRAKLWPPEEASVVLSELIAHTDLVVCTSEDARDLFEVSTPPTAMASALAERFGIERVVITSGADGAWWHHNGFDGHAPAIPVSVVDRIGAGDAFMAGVLDGLMDDSLDQGVSRGTALAALALTTRGDRPIVSRDEMDQVLEGSVRRVDR